MLSSKIGPSNTTSLYPQYVTEEREFISRKQFFEILIPGDKI